MFGHSVQNRSATSHPLALGAQPYGFFATSTLYDAIACGSQNVRCVTSEKGLVFHHENDDGGTLGCDWHRHERNPIFGANRSAFGQLFFWAYGR